MPYRKERMRFRPFGRSLHLEITSASGLARAAELDEAHWVATSAPLGSFDTDKVLLSLLDADGNGRLTCHELAAAIRWTLGVLKDHQGIDAGSDQLSIDHIRRDHADGPALREAARKTLARLGEPSDQAVTLQQVRSVKSRIEATPVSEGGVVLPEAAKDPQLVRFLQDVIATVGGAPHPSGQAGVSSTELDAFLSQARAWLEFRQRGRIPPDGETTAVMPLGEQTPQAFDVYASLRGKLEQFFAQCEAAALDPRLLERMDSSDQRRAQLDFDDPAVIRDMLRRAPLARPNPDRILRLADGINPSYASEVDQFRHVVLQPLFGERLEVLAADQFQHVADTFAAHQAWRDSQPETAVASLDEQTLRAHLQPDREAAVRELIAESRETAIAMDSIRLLEKLLLYQAHLCQVANNFVSFPRLYSTRQRALFEMGTLVMDGRRFNLAVRAENREEHAAVARTSDMYVMYVQVSPGPGQMPMELAVPVTSGGKGNLGVGKHGVFYTARGEEWTARVVSVIENPISLREAVVGPFRRIGHLITSRIESLSREAEQKLDAEAGTAIQQVGPRLEQQSPPQTAAFGSSAGGMVLGAGVAVAALGSALAYISKTLAQIEQTWWILLVGVLVAAGIVMVPTAILAMLKLRRRDLSAILEGAGWAINARMRLNRAQARHFTRRPRYPRGARGTHRLLWRRVLWIVLAMALLIGIGWLVQVLA